MFGASCFGNRLGVGFVITTRGIERGIIARGENDCVGGCNGMDYRKEWTVIVEGNVQLFFVKAKQLLDKSVGVDIIGISLR